MRRLALAAGAAVLLWVAACADPPVDPRGGIVGGRVLVAPGAPLVGAHVTVDQVNLYNGLADIRKHVGETVTDDQGNFDGLHTGTINGLILVDASGGTFTDPITGARVQLDSSVHLKALHWLGIFEDRSLTSPTSPSMYVTPIHALVEARFRFKQPKLADTITAVEDTYAHLNAHFGNLDWEKVIPADLTKPAASPTDDVRAAFILGGLAVLADDIRASSDSTPQVVNVMTLLQAMTQDVSADQFLDGNDRSSNVFGEGIQIGECPPPVAGCAIPDSGCTLGACRPLCDLFVNTYRNLLGGEISKFIGTQPRPSVWNQTGLGSQDARPLIDSIARNVDADLFAMEACFDTADRLPPTIGWEAPTPADGAFVKSTLAVRVSATDDTGSPKAKVTGFADTDGDDTNSGAAAIIDTVAALGGSDGSLTVIAEATDLAGNVATAMRTFQVDNTLPVVTIDSTGLFVDPGNVWWTGNDAPTLHGTFMDAHPDRVEVLVGGRAVPAVVNGSEWSATLPAGTLVANENIVTVRGIDQAGNAGVTIQTVRVDTAPPVIAINSSQVHDEINTTFDFKDDAPGPRVVHDPSGTPQVDLSIEGSCPTVRKHVHLLSQPGPGPGQPHAVFGSFGDLNSLKLNVAVSDESAGGQPGAVEYRVGVLQSNGTIGFQIDWTALPPGTTNGDTTSYVLPFYRDGAHGIPALGTTNGEYHVELRAADRFGHTSSTSRCWNHIILAPPLKQLNGSGVIATGFPLAMFSLRLNPAPNEFGAFASRFLNADAIGVAMWNWRFQNYLGEPVYVTAHISQGVTANISRQFGIVNTSTDEVDQVLACSETNTCAIFHPSTEYTSNLDTAVASLVLRAYMFGDDGTQFGTCPGCINDDSRQTYQFQVPPRGAAIPAYSIFSWLIPQLPAGGSSVGELMTPRDANRPDTDPSPYREFGPNSTVYTGKLIGPPGQKVCLLAGSEGAGTRCLKWALTQRYRALTKIQFQLLDPILTRYTFAATPFLPSAGEITGPLSVQSGNLTTDEAPLR